MSNALKFTQHGSVKVFCQLEEKKLHFLVKDTGVGISQHDQHRLFQIYAKGRDNANMNRNGTGLGLNICKSIIERLNGSIWVESQPGEGTEVHFLIEPEVVKIKQIDDCGLVDTH